MKANSKFFIILYSCTALLFLAYFFFIYENNQAKHRELNQKIENLENSIVNTKNHVNNTFTFDQLMKDSLLLEQYAREQLNMQKNDEDVFIVVYE